jgi:non-ribosomal peptide synthetase component F
MPRASFRPSTALMRAVFERRGLGLDAMQVAMFVHEWAMLEAERGHRVTSTEFANAGIDAPATAYRRLKLFREAFGDELGAEATPSDLIVWPEGLPLPAKSKRDAFGLAVPVAP